METNHLSISGCIVERSDLRYTPGGVPFFHLYLEHRSRQVEVGVPREVFCRIRVDFRGEEFTSLAEMLEPGQKILVKGFLARSGFKDERSNILILHAQSVVLM